jgi:hypothetical protein
MNKNGIGKELFYFFVFTVFGLVIYPVLLLLLARYIRHDTGPISFSGFFPELYPESYGTLVGNPYWFAPGLPVCWLLVLCPYVLFQLIRTVYTRF